MEIFCFKFPFCYTKLRGFIVIGVDIVEIDRFSRIKNKKMLISIFTDKELNSLSKQKFNETKLACFFSIKEAFVKALGTGFSKGISPTNIEVIIEKNLFKINLYDKAKLVFTTKKFKNIKLSISQSRNSVIALCFIS